MRAPRRIGLLVALLVALQLQSAWGGRRGARPARPGRVATAQSRRAAAAKFKRAARFAGHLPRVRASVRSSLRKPKLDRDTAVAAIVRIMDTTYMRVGSERYTQKEKPSYGASSLRKDQVRVRGDRVWFDFPGKSAVHWKRDVRDPELARAVRIFLKGPGERLFQLPDGAVTETHVRAFLRQYGGRPKDFRTIHANRLLDLELARMRGPPSEALLSQAIRRVAEPLGHTPAVSRGSYLDPLRIERYLSRGQKGRATPRAETPAKRR